MNILEKICQDKQLEVRGKKKLLSGQEICAKIKCSDHKPKNFTAAIEAKLKQKNIAIIAEVKKASPSKGIIRDNFDIWLSVLIEIHDEEELQKALKLKSRLIGINNRNLKTFEISLSTSIDLSKKIPQDKIIVCESGIFTKADILKMQKISINAFLVGESLMRQDNIGLALRNLLD